MPHVTGTSAYSLLVGPSGAPQGSPSAEQGRERHGTVGLHGTFSGSSEESLGDSPWVLGKGSFGHTGQGLAASAGAISFTLVAQVILGLMVT